MDAFVGTWKSNAEDSTGLEEYGKAIGMTDLMEQYKNGCQLEVTKQDDCWVFTTYIGGQMTGKETLNLTGKYSVEMGGQIIDSKMKVDFKDGKLCVDGTMMGSHFKTVRYIDNGRFMNENYTGSTKMTTKLSKV